MGISGGSGLVQAAVGRLFGPALLFFGCAHPDIDDLYRAEFEAREAAGVVSVRPAYSEAPQASVRFVQPRLWQDPAEIAALFRQGAHAYLCSDGWYMPPEVRETFIRIHRSRPADRHSSFRPSFVIHHPPDLNLIAQRIRPLQSPLPFSNRCCQPTACCHDLADLQHDIDTA